MKHTFFRIVAHPFSVFLVIALLECRPYYDNADKTIYNQLPKIGQNFKAPDDYSVYYYSGKGKYIYSSAECYFKLGNPPWSASVKEGGVITIKASVVKQIPLIGKMCADEMQKRVEVKQIEKKIKSNAFKNYLSFNFLVDNYSEIAHVFSYVILAFSICYKYLDRKRKFWFAFLGCFFGGAFLEMIQYFFIVGRSASWNDQMHNTLGAIVGIIAFWTINRTKAGEKVHNNP